MKAQKRQTRFYGYSTAGSGQWGLKMLSEEFLRSGLNSETFLKRKTKESASNAGDLGLIPGLGRSSEAENDNPLQYSCLENSMDRGAWRATDYRVTKSRTRLK